MITEQNLNMLMLPCFMQKKSIARQFNAHRTPQQNGVAERKNRTLIEATRSMLVVANIPIMFWDEAISPTKIACA